MTQYVTKRFDEPDSIRSVSSTEQNTCGAPSAPFTHTELARRRRGSYTGVRTPGWRKLIADGKIVPLQSYSRYDEISSQSGRRQLTWKTRSNPDCYRIATIASCGIFEDFGYLPSETELLDITSKHSSVGERLLQTAASDITSDFDALTFLAELRQVKGMFLSLAPSLIRQLLSKPPQKAAASVWLQWQMGWKPFISDINSIIDVINKPNGASRNKKTKRTSIMDEIPINAAKVLLNGEKHTVTGSSRYSVDIRATVIADISALANNAYINPVSTAWELIPWSFLIDYFVGIGDWIKANSLVLAGVNYTASVGYDVTLTRTLKLTGAPPSTGSLVQYTANGEANVYARMKLRVPRTISLGNLPPINEEVQSVTRIINMIALALQKTR